MSTVGKWTKFGRDGFTLFELIVVIAILAIMAGVIVPTINLDFGGGGAETAVRRVQTAMDQARTRARLTRSGVTVQFFEGYMSVSGEGRNIELPSGARFERIVMPGEDAGPVSSLKVDRRGIAPASIVILKVDDQTYSLLVSPVLRNVEYLSGTADFEDFAD